MCPPHCKQYSSAIRNLSAVEKELISPEVHRVEWVPLHRAFALVKC